MKFALSERPCLVCKASDARWKDHRYRLVRCDTLGRVAHPWCLIKKHGEEKAKAMVPAEEWAKRALA